MPKKLIEVALPLEAINTASAREKSIRHGHPSTLHLWWARRPLAACRAVLFASLVDDPSARPDLFPTEAQQDAERDRLFGIVEELVQWENSGSARVLDAARAEIMRSTGGSPPPVLDPFCGGGSIPLEAQRLGLEAHASDLNPVAVLITKALIEIPPKFAARPPVHPGVERSALGVGTWAGAQGLAEDVRRYGQWMRDEAEKRIGPLYPKAAVVQEADGSYRPAKPDEIQNPKSKIQNLTVIAWLWARTVACPNPACGARMPLVRSFALSTKPGKQAWVEPVADAAAKQVRFTVKAGAGKPPDGTVGRRGARCLVCGSPVPLEHVRAEGRAKRMGAQLMAVVAEGRGGRVYLPPTPEHEQAAAQAQPDWRPETDLVPNSRHMTPVVYGMTTHADLFTPRQLVALSTFSDLVGEARERVRQDAAAAGLEAGRAQEYADAVATYLGLGVSRLSDICNALCMWENTKTQARHLFTRQAIPMLWDFAEPNVFGSAAGDYAVSLGNLAHTLDATPARGRGNVRINDATDSARNAGGAMVSTDPPYYDNVPYADLSDFFYVWLRRSLRPVYPDLFGTMLVPKAPELVADPFRHGGREEARRFFEEGMGCVFANIRRSANPEYPVTVYYAFKQTEAEGGEEKADGAGQVASTGWETMLQGLIDSGFQVTGTWPMRTELGNRMRGLDSNALASSIVLVCRPRPDGAPVATRREFVNALRGELQEALLHMMRGSIAPVDLAQAAIGPGMAVYSRYRRVVETDGAPLRVRAALQLINEELDAILSAQEGGYDGDTRFCLAWFEQFGMSEAAFGQADVMARAKNTSVEGLREAGVLEARAGRVRLLKREEYPADWDPKADARRPVWECCQQLVRALLEQGDEGAARLYARMRGDAEAARDLAYRLYTVCERKDWAQEALAYNSLVIAWPEITRLAASPPAAAQPALAV